MINQLYLRLNDQSSLTDKIDYFSQALLNKPYELTALGEGPGAQFDQAPLYRLDAFDCETYVDTVLALSFGHDLASFKEYMRRIRYHGGKMNYIHRNHFLGLDWNGNNQAQHFIKDITITFHDENGHSVAKYARALIDKPSWYRHFTIHKIRIPNLSTEQKLKKLKQLQEQGSHLKSVVSILAYIPLDRLFDDNHHINSFLLHQIPNGAIIEIVRPNWDLTKEIGTHLNVSHLGFAIWKRNTLYFRNASSLDMKTVDTPLIDYLRQCKQQSKTIKGIHVQMPTIQ